MNCKVTINNGKPDGSFTSRGRLNFGGEGFSLFYEIDGDKCVLTYSNGSVVQERFGSVPMVMRFTEGKETKCTLGRGTARGSFDVFTDRITAESDEKSASVKLNYILAGELVTLEITAK